MINQKLSNLEKSSLSGKNILKNVYVGEVVANEDPLNAGRIKVRIPNLDINKQIFCKKIKNNGQNVRNFYKVQGAEKLVITDDTVLNYINNIDNPSTSQNVGNDSCVEIPWSTPFLPKHYQILPKVGEMVKVIFFDPNEPNLNREWIGPVISLKDKYAYDDVLTAGSTMNTAPIYVQVDPTDTEQLRKKGEFTGGFSQPLDISIQSRNNADIVMPTFQDGNGSITRGGEVLIRAGKLLLNSNNQYVLNDKNPAYFRLKVLTSRTLDLNKNPDTYAMLFSDYISFVSHKNGEKGSEGITKINPILENDKQIEDAFNSLQPMVRGKFLIEFLELIRNYVANHDHPYAGLPATNANSKPEILQYNLNKILSPNIRIN